MMGSQDNINHKLNQRFCRDRSLSQTLLSMTDDEMREEKRRILKRLVSIYNSEQQPVAQGS